MSVLTSQIAKQLRDTYFGGNWTWVNFKDTLQNITWQDAVKKVGSLNTIAALVYHTGYYITGVMQKLQGGELSIKDKYAFDHPVIDSEESWNRLVESAYANAGKFADIIEQLPESKLWEIFEEEKYGNYFRNLTGIIEHLHYHLGQIVLIKKLIAEGK
jgi:hypothetical protein